MPVRILFVCYENLCRSPMAEGVFRHLSKQGGGAGFFEVESAGTVCYQAGSFPDQRAVMAAGRYGIDISRIRSQCIHDLDMNGFDLVFTMDHDNYREVLDALDDGSRTVVYMMTEFAGGEDVKEIEDPYYGPEEGFESTMKTLIRCVEGILSHLLEAQGSVDDTEACDSPETVQKGIRDAAR